MNSDEFSMTSALGSFIVNNNFQSGFVDYQLQKPSHEAFIYQVLSAVGDNLGSTVYDNVKRYVDYISNVDICKVRALKSMLQLFDFKNTVLDCIEALPEEIVSLLDILSIDKKRLLRAGFLRPGFLAHVLENGGVLTFDDFAIDLNKTFSRGSLTLSCNCFCTTQNPLEIPTAFKKMCQTYRELNYAGTAAFIRSNLSADSDLCSKIMLVNEASESDLSSAKIYINDYKFSIWKTTENAVLYDNTFTPLANFYPESLDDLSSNQLFNDDRAISDLLEDIEGAAGSEFYNKTVLSSLKNQGSTLKVIYQNLRFDEDPTRIDEQQYEEMLRQIFRTVLHDFLALKYNFTTNHNGRTTSYCIYPDLGAEYYQKNYHDFSEIDSTLDGSYEQKILETKRFNHVQKSFDEKKILDAIEVGDDDFSNYSGAELSVLQIENARRHASVDTQKMSKFSGKLTPSQKNATRGSYYRARKVLEYANFIDNYFAQVQQDGDLYSYDPNYFEVTNQDDPDLVISNSNPSGNPSVDFNHQMIDEVAEYLAKLAIYINKIREKIKLQTQKNYMKGTNLLLIYIINEWLIDYGRHNAKRFLEDPRLSAESVLSGFEEIFSSLSSHQFSTNPGMYTIGVNENYDETEYFNIETRTSVSAQLSGGVNERYWEKTTIGAPEMMKGDGFQYKIAEIERFYLSTLALQNPLSVIGSSLQEFLSTIYDLGANDSFMYRDPELSSTIFSSTLSSGEIASDLFARLVELSSNWKAFNDYLPEEDGYEWPNSVISDQISNVLETKMFQDLSDRYMVGISDVYNKHNPAVESISSSMGQLSSNYTSFISSEYSYYYKKFENCKYLYENYDLDNGVYLCPYYVGNPQFDDPENNLYECLHQLEVYSSSENIKNWSLLCTVAYVNDMMTQLTGNIGSIVGDLASKYGFVDVNAIALDDELKYVYDYLNQNIETRKQFLMDQLKTLQAQATNCKTQYETLNNTFTNAVASYNDNDTGYTLGDDEVIAVSLTQNLSDNTGWTRSDNKPKSSEYTWLYCKYVDKWYASKPGKWEAIANPVQKYESSKPLETRIEALLDYMSKPTAFSGETMYYGLADEGIKAVCENVKSGLEDIDTSYEQVKSMAHDLFGISPSIDSADLYKNILSLIEKLVAIDETFFSKDANIEAYQGYLTRVIKISSDYLPVKQAFDGIFTDNELQSYMFDFTAVRDLTFDNLSKLERYRSKTDGKNLEIIQSKIRGLLNTYSDLLQKKRDLEQAIYDDGVAIRISDGNQLEAQLSTILETLLETIVQRTNLANSIINQNKQKIWRYVDSISTEISADLGIDGITLPESVDAKLSSLNFFQHPIYNKYRKLMLTYGGREFCYDPYYNIKNQTHPSYQVHPYLWNIVKKIQGQTLLGSGFKSTVVSELEEANFDANVKKYFGEFKETINTWRAAPNGLVDWSGYVSRYERSPNTTAAGIVNEVVDYDGIFYPPAVEEFVALSSTCISSVNNQKTSRKLASDIMRDVNAKLASNQDGVSALFMFDEETEKITHQSILDYADTRESVANYTDPTTIDASLDDQFIGKDLSSVSVAAVASAVNAAIPATFFEKYYQHLQLPDSQLKFISQQLTEYASLIKEIATSKDRTSNEDGNKFYDIYKYGLDIQGNSYILLKSYDYSKLFSREKLSYKQKKNTLGELWIRLASHPIAFPAFHGTHPAYYIQETNQLNPSIIHLAELTPNGIKYKDPKTKKLIECINSRMCVFYDFEMTQNQANLFLISYNADLGDSFDEFYNQFQFGWVIPNVVRTKYDQTQDLEWLVLECQP